MTGRPAPGRTGPHGDLTARVGIPSGELEPHPIAELFPLMAQESFEDLVRSVHRNGLRDPIVLSRDGRIVDGRNRYLACRAANVEPRFVTTELTGDELLGWVVDVNLHRRHLTESQRALAAARIATYSHGGSRHAQAAHVPVAGLTQREAGERLGVSERSVRDGRLVLDHGPEELVDAVADGLLAVRAAAELIRAAGKDRALAAEFYRLRRSTRSQEWYTPSDLVRRIESFLGGIDLDPASNSHEAPWVPARTHLTADDDGLAHPWQGKVFLNPPFSHSPAPWVKKLRNHFEAGDISEGLALLPARTNTNWMRVLAPYPRLFIWGRLRFSDASGRAQFPSVLVYLGARIVDFVDAFSDIGDAYLHASGSHAGPGAVGTPNQA